VAVTTRCPPRVQRWLLPCLLPCLVVACSGTAEWGGRVEVRDDVEVVSNPSAPLLRDARGVVTELWAVRRDDWADPTLVHVGSGLITVVDPRVSRVHVVSEAGEVLRSIGNTGRGPGEFLHLLDAFPFGESVAVLDVSKTGIEYLALDGAYLSALSAGGAVWGGFPLSDGEWLLKGEFFTDPSEETTGDWISVMGGREPVPFTPPPLEQLPDEQGVQCSEVFPWAGGAARFRLTTPRIQVLDRAANVAAEIRVDLAVEPVSEGEREAALSGLRRRQAGHGEAPEHMQQFIMVMRERWRVKCRFGPLRFDPVGRLAAFLEQNPDEFGSGNATLHFLSESGVYLAKVVFPTAWRDFTLNGGVVYALTRDPETDLVTLRAYGVDLPSALVADAAEVLEEARRRATEDR